MIGARLAKDVGDAEEHIEWRARVTVVPAEPHTVQLDHRAVLQLGDSVAQGSGPRLCVRDINRNVCYYHGAPAPTTALIEVSRSGSFHPYVCADADTGLQVVKLCTVAKGMMLDLGLSLKFESRAISNKGFLPITVTADPSKAKHVPALLESGQAEVKRLCCLCSVELQ
jgi:hypothetical protein